MYALNGNRTAPNHSCLFLGKMCKNFINRPSLSNSLILKSNRRNLD
jgi:hypothetical protein